MQGLGTIRLRKEIPVCRVHVKDSAQTSPYGEEHVNTAGPRGCLFATSLESGFKSQNVGSQEYWLA